MLKCPLTTGRKMTYCTNCGKPIDSNAQFCPECGARQNIPAARSEPYQSRQEEDDGNILWGLLGFVVPIAGIILWALWMNDRPRCAKVAGIGALISIIIGIIATVAFLLMVYNNGDVYVEWTF